MKQKAQDSEAALWWAERGLSRYGDEGIRPDYVDDLEKRVDKYRERLKGSWWLATGTNLGSANKEDSEVCESDPD